MFEERQLEVGRRVVFDGIEYLSFFVIPLLLIRIVLFSTVELSRFIWHCFVRARRYTTVHFAHTHSEYSKPPVLYNHHINAVRFLQSALLASLAVLAAAEKPPAAQVLNYHSCSESRAKQSTWRCCELARPSRRQIPPPQYLQLA